jgi:transposase, IS5 family
VSRSANPQISFADWELLQQGLVLEPVLRAIADFLDDHAEMIEPIRCDLRRGLKNPDTGRKGLTPQQVLRSLILMRVKNWDYRELRERIADGCTLRRFADFHCQPVPKHDAFNRAFTRLTPPTLRLVNELLVQAAVAMGLEDGSKLRVDTTVVQTDIHHPTDNTLLWDVVRVVTRLVGRLAKAIGRRIKEFRDRTRAARRRMQALQRMTTTQRPTQQTGKYRELIGIAEEVVECARAALWDTRKMRGKDLLCDLAIEELRREIDHYCGLGERVIDQARRRVLHGEQVPNAEKIYSIFEPHTDLIKRGKVRTPVEFGHKIFIAESAHGLITQYEVLSGNPSDEDHVEPSLKRHKEAFGGVPRLYSSDRGFFSDKNVTACRQGGVEVVCIPQRGGKKTVEREGYEKSSAFKKGQRFRAGIEGRISVLFRGRGMKRCLAEGRERFELLVGAAVFANNLLTIASLLMARSSARRRAA